MCPVPPCASARTYAARVKERCPGSSISMHIIMVAIVVAVDVLAYGICLWSLRMVEILATCFD